MADSQLSELGEEVIRRPNSFGCPEACVKLLLEPGSRCRTVETAGQVLSRVSQEASEHHEDKDRGLESEG